MLLIEIPSLHYDRELIEPNPTDKQMQISDLTLESVTTYVMGGLKIWKKN